MIYQSFKQSVRCFKYCFIPISWTDSYGQVWKKEDQCKGFTPCTKIIDLTSWPFFFLLAILQWWSWSVLDSPPSLHSKSSQLLLRVWSQTESRACIFLFSIHQMLPICTGRGRDHILSSLSVRISSLLIFLT